MRRRVWLIALCLYAVAGIADGVDRAARTHLATGEPVGPGEVAVAFCAGLFWPLDIATRILLDPR